MLVQPPGNVNLISIDVMDSLVSYNQTNSQTEVMKSLSVMDLGDSRALVHSTDLVFISLGKRGSWGHES